MQKNYSGGTIEPISMFWTLKSIAAHFFKSKPDLDPTKKLLEMSSPESVDSQISLFLSY
jgi:hypothetical protein